MSISMKKFAASTLTRAGACALAATIAACGGGHHHDGHPPPPPAGLSYDVIPLTLGGTGINGLVGRQGINSKGQVAGPSMRRTAACMPFCTTANGRSTWAC
jgi:hypothetical protein